MDSNSTKTNTHEPSSDVHDREARIQARRQRIELRNSSTDDASRHKKQSLDESKRMSRSQQQIADSLNQLDRRKLASIQQVTNVRVTVDDVENKRRMQEEGRRHQRMELLHQEAMESNSKNAAIEMHWSDLLEHSMPQELYAELETQKRACEEILASKTMLIHTFQTQLKQKDEEYVVSLKTQAEEMETLIERMRLQYRELQQEYEMELENMEETFLKEREETIASNKLEIDALFEKRREMEMCFMEKKQIRDEQYMKEMEDLRIKDTEEYNELKIKLETNIQTLEQQLEEMRATYQLNTEKLEYNYRVLTERDMENSATLSQQKRKLTRLKDVLSTLMIKYHQTDQRDRHQNQELTEEYRRITKQYKELQKKYIHFETRDSIMYQDVWKMHEEEILVLINKLLQANKIIHEQQLGLTWIPPSQSIRLWRQEKEREQVEEKTVEIQQQSQDESETDQPVVENRISSAKLKYMLKLLAKEAGFLVHNNVQQALENLPEDEMELVKADMIMRTLGIENEEEMERLMRLFYKDPRAEIPLDGKTTISESSLTIPTSKWGLTIGPEDVIRVCKQFVEEMNQQKRKGSIRLLHRASQVSTQNETNVDDPRRSKFNSLEKTKGKAKRTDKDYWDAVVQVIPPHTIRVMHVLEKALTSYHQALLKRKGLIDEVGALQEQNIKLKTLLKQYLGAPINEDLIIPPAQMQNKTKF